MTEDEKIPLLDYRYYKECIECDFTHESYVEYIKSMHSNIYSLLPIEHSDYMKYLGSNSMPAVIRVIIATGSDFEDYSLLCRKIDTYLENYDPKEIKIVFKTDKNLEIMGERYANEFKLKSMPIDTDWDKHGKSAAYKSDHQAIMYSTHLIAFWDGHSKDIESLINIAKRKKMPFKVISYAPEQISMYDI